MSFLRDQFAVWFSLVVGAMDTVTGILLVTAPAQTVAMFGADLPAGDDIAMRFVGAFVCSVGSTYLWALKTGSGVAREERIVGIWRATTIIRSVIAVFVSAAVVTGRLDLPWATVAVSDAGVAIVQAVWLRKRGTA